MFTHPQIATAMLFLYSGAHLPVLNRFKILVWGPLWRNEMHFLSQLPETPYGITRNRHFQFEKNMGGRALDFVVLLSVFPFITETTETF